jgi:hypothetical protein
MDSPLKMDSRKIDTFPLSACLQRIVNDDVGDAIEYALVTMTGRKDTPQLFTDKEMRRIENRLRHAATTYDKLIAGVFKIFKEACDEQGLKLASSFCEQEYRK